MRLALRAVLDAQDRHLVSGCDVVAGLPEQGAAASLDAQLTADGFEIAPEGESPAHRSRTLISELPVPLVVTEEAPTTFLAELCMLGTGRALQELFEP
jgi:hypothetical protein